MGSEIPKWKVRGAAAARSAEVGHREVLLEESQGYSLGWTGAFSPEGELPMLVLNYPVTLLISGGLGDK